MWTDEKYQEARDDAEQHEKHQPWCDNGPVAVGIWWHPIKGEWLLCCFEEARRSISLIQDKAGCLAAARWQFASPYQVTDDQVACVSCGREGLWSHTEVLNMSMMMEKRATGGWERTLRNQLQSCEF